MARKRKPGHEQVCIYCRENIADTTDHVPPESMLQQPYPLNLWTVPACTECNTSYSRDEEYFRAWVIGLFCFNEAAKEMFDGPIRACFDHSPRLKNKVFNSIGVEGERTFVTAEGDRLSRVVAKVVMGLHQLKCGFGPDKASRYEISFHHNEPPAVPPVLAACEFDRKLAPAFAFRYVMTCPQASSSIWQLTHFGEVHWLVYLSSLWATVPPQYAPEQLDLSGQG